MTAPVSPAPLQASWPEWAVRALVALAGRILRERNQTCGKDWPAGQEWHELGHTSQHAFMRAAREECGVPHDSYKEAVQAVSDSGEYDLDMVWADMDRRSEVFVSSEKLEQVNVAPAHDVVVPRELVTDALNYIRHCGANAVMRGERHPQYMIVQGLEHCLATHSQSERGESK